MIYMKKKTLYTIFKSRDKKLDILWIVIVSKRIKKVFYKEAIKNLLRFNVKYLACFVFGFNSCIILKLIFLY